MLVVVMSLSRREVKFWGVPFWFFCGESLKDVCGIYVLGPCKGWLLC